jgi:hypothetical protein
MHKARFAQHQAAYALVVLLSFTFFARPWVAAASIGNGPISILN